MNGHCKFIDAEGVEHTLYFGMQAVEEFAKRVEKYLTENAFKITADMVFAGIANHMTKNDIVPLSYTEVYEILEKLLESDKASYEKQAKEIADAFWESKYGSEYSEVLNEVKKKVQKEIQSLLKGQTSTGEGSEDMG